MSLNTSETIASKKSKRSPQMVRAERRVTAPVPQEKNGAVPGQVTVTIEDVVIPTYMPAAPDKNPMFLEKRVYQGSNG